MIDVALHHARRLARIREANKQARAEGRPLITDTTISLHDLGALIDVAKAAVDVVTDSPLDSEAMEALARAVAVRHDDGIGEEEGP